MQSMTSEAPRIRTDLELFPIQHAGQQFILVKDHLGLVEEGKAVPLALYQLMAELDGTKTVRDLQMIFMRQRGGILVGSEEVERLLAQLDDAFLLDSRKYQQARDQVVTRFCGEKIRPNSHAGKSYPAQAPQLRERIESILAGPSTPSVEAEGICALVAPHIDLTVGGRVFGNAYRFLRQATPSRVVVLGVGHQLQKDLFCLTEKDFETPLGVVKNDREAVKLLRKAGQSVISENDFPHRSEHSVEFQVLFLQHLLPADSFRLVPVLCGHLMSVLSEYTRSAYLQKVGAFLSALSQLISEREEETLLIAGVDFSHIGPKFGHDRPALYMESQTESHDRNLLSALAAGDADAFWEESIRVRDQFNVCGFSAMAALLETLPQSDGKVLDYQMWHEEATRSAVSFAALAFLKRMATKGTK